MRFEAYAFIFIITFWFGFLVSRAKPKNRKAIIISALLVALGIGILVFGYLLFWK